MKLIAKFVAASVSAALLAGSAQAGCWNEAEYQAAHVKELETMLLVEALKCRGTPTNFLEAYNTFIETNRPALTQVNATMKGWFAKELGAKAAENALDSYLIKVANRYGGASQCADMAAITNAAGQTEGNSDALYKVAVTYQAIPTVPGEVCTATSGASATTELVKR